MPMHSETLLGDVSGLPLSLDSVGMEIPNKSSRRRVDFNEYGFCRVQWADSQGPGITNIRIEYSFDGGNNWGVLIPDVPGVNGVYENDCSDWIAVPPDIVSAPYNVLIRAMITGAVGSTKVTYVTIQMR